MEDEENTIRMRQDDFFLMLKGKIKGTRQLPDSLFGAADGTQSEPEAPASVTCFLMDFTRWSSENSQYTCQPHIMGEYNKLEFAYANDL